MLQKQNKTTLQFSTEALKGLLRKKFNCVLTLGKAQKKLKERHLKKLEKTRCELKKVRSSLIWDDLSSFCQQVKRGGVLGLEEGFHTVTYIPLSKQICGLLQWLTLVSVIQVICVEFTYSQHHYGQSITVYPKAISAGHSTRLLET